MTMFRLTAITAGLLSSISSFASQTTHSFHCENSEHSLVLTVTVDQANRYVTSGTLAIDNLRFDASDLSIIKTDNDDRYFKFLRLDLVDAHGVSAVSIKAVNTYPASIRSVTAGNAVFTSMECSDSIRDFVDSYK